MASNRPINRLTKHVYKECSDLVRLPPIFSCDACDRWRNRVHEVQYKQQRSLNRSSLSSRYQCTRLKKGYKPIHVRIICSAGGKEESNDESNMSEEIQECEEVANVPLCLLSIPKRSEKIRKGEEVAHSEMKRLRAQLVVEKLEEVKQAEYSKQKLKEKEEEYDEIQRHNLSLQTKLDVTECKLKSAQVLTNYYRKQNACKEIYKLKKTTGELNNKTDPMKYLCSSVEKIVGTILPGKHAHEKASLLIDALCSEKMWKGEGLKILNEMKRMHIRHIFKAWKLLKAFDCSSVGAFKTSTLQAMHAVLDKDKQGFFPSASSVDRCRKLLDNHGKKLVGYERKVTKYGEVYYMNFDNVIRLLLRATGLYSKAQHSNVSIAFTADGAALMNSRTHVSCGVKITDVDGVHPLTRMPLTNVSDDNDENSTCFNLVQSRELCAILVMADAKDSKALYNDVFKEFYEYSEKLRQFGMEATESEPALKPFIVTHPQDMKSAQTVSNKGGNCKMKKYFCHLCSCRKDELIRYKFSGDRCNRCKAAHRARCYHHALCDSISTEKLLSELDGELNTYMERCSASYSEIKKKSKILTDPLQVNKESDISHIDFIIPENDLQRKSEFSMFIARECVLRKIPTHGKSVEEWRDALRSCVFAERRIQCLISLKEWKDSGKDDVPLLTIIELLIPCILHLENRVGEKIITMILRKGLDEFQGIPSHYLSEMEHIMQCKILGSDASPSHWKLRWNRKVDGGIEIDPVQEQNSTVRCMMQSVDLLIEQAFPGDNNEKRTKLIKACSKYCSAIKLLTLHRILTDAEQEEFQDLVDDFYEIWVELFSTEGITNYIHLLSSGHILYFLQKYKCLYLYSQQGWEHLNSICTGYILHNSARGGKNTGEDGNKSYIYPLIRYLVRDLLWKTGEGDCYFIEWEADKKK